MTTHPRVNELPTDARSVSVDEAVPEIALTTFLQPFYNLRNDRLQGLEALVRLLGTDGRPQSPAGFFVDAADSGRLRAVDLRVLEEAVAHMARLRQDATTHDLILSVNLSWDSIAHPTVVTDITRALARHELPPDRLLLDITTDTFRRWISAGTQVRTRLHRLQSKEITFCLDGFTAEDLDILSDAVATPVDIIKLHPRVLGSASATQQLAGVAQAIADVGLPVVAAGVETREQLDVVRELGFEWAQGFLLGEPVDADQARRHPFSSTLR